MFHLTRILEAPDELDEIIAREPLAKGLLDVLQQQGGMDLRSNDDRFRLLRMLELRRAMIRVGTSIPGLAPAFGESPLMQLFNEPKLAPVWELLVPHVRKRLLADYYHMEVDRMIKYTIKYGPLDWRHPATQRGILVHARRR